MGRGLTTSTSKLSQNPFKGDASLVIRFLFAHPEKQGSGQEIAQELGLSQAWVNRVLGTLEMQGIVQREVKGPSSITYLVNPKGLLKKWIHQYQISFNRTHLYLLFDKSPLKKLVAIAEKEKWHFALTGYAAANFLSPVSEGTPPMVYLWPKSEIALPFRRVLARLENQYRFIPVRKEANLIIVEPFLKETVFFDSREVKGLPIVSPLQLFLDLYGLDQGKYIINSLAPFWGENGMPYDL